MYISNIPILAGKPIHLTYVGLCEALGLSHVPGTALPSQCESSARPLSGNFRALRDLDLHGFEGSRIPGLPKALRVDQLS